MRSCFSRLRLVVGSLGNVSWALEGPGEGSWAMEGPGKGSGAVEDPG